MHDDRRTPGHIRITETLLRLYVFLAQHLDRCLQVGPRGNDANDDLEGHLASTRTAILEMLSANPVVKAKVERECQHVLALAAAYITDGTETAPGSEALAAERAVLKHKTMALSDLLAVFRALSDQNPTGTSARPTD